MREGTAVTDLLLIAAVLLIGLGMTAVVARMRAVGRFGRVGQIGFAATSVGGALGLAGRFVQALFFGGNFGPSRAPALRFRRKIDHKARCLGARQWT